MVSIDLNKINPHALFIARTLRENHFESYIVGGAVRDLLLEKKPNDYDIATSATNTQIHALFKNSKIVKGRFPITVVYKDKENFDVSTFSKKDFCPTKASSLQFATEDNSFDRLPGTIEEDSCRRDITINALYVDPYTGDVLDFFDGLKDLQENKICFIGDIKQKLIEDPVRILRAIRISARLDFDLQEGWQDAFLEASDNLYYQSKSRMYYELMKILYSGYSYPIFKKLIEVRAFSKNFPCLYQTIKNEFSIRKKNVLKRFFKAIDQYIQNGNNINPQILISLLLLYKNISISGNEASFIIAMKGPNAFSLQQDLSELHCLWDKDSISQKYQLYKSIMIGEDSKLSEEDLYEYIQNNRNNEWPFIIQDLLNVLSNSNSQKVITKLTTYGYFDKIPQVQKYLQTQLFVEKKSCFQKVIALINEELQQKYYLSEVSISLRLIFPLLFSYLQKGLDLESFRQHYQDRQSNHAINVDSDFETIVFKVGCAKDQTILKQAFEKIFFFQISFYYFCFNNVLTYEEDFYNIYQLFQIHADNDCNEIFSYLKSSRVITLNEFMNKFLVSNSRNGVKTFTKIHAIVNNISLK